ncbi:hypothetical protein [Erythrobacter sp. MTPC3]|uniref:hypothetical protein n=1 Tax=Erythrobacter sp. MTPC3 TaxID=3056564 RepID=UPI0036F23FA2
MRVAPKLTLELLSARSQKFIIERERSTGRLAASQKFVAEHGRTVLAGPFAGMVYPEATAQERNLIHRLTGSYESELHPWIEEIAASDYGMLLDIGTADGFYAVGFARLMPDTRVIGFDTDRWARQATQNLVDLNETHNVDVESMCDPAWINRNVTPNSLIFSDCEGYEAVLFDLDLCPILRECDMVIELHERPAPGVEQLLRGRFKDTHDCRLVTYMDHDPALFPQLASVEESMRELVISEGRGGPQNVIFLTRKTV